MHRTVLCVLQTAAICLALLACAAHGQKKPGVAVLELGGNGIDTSQLSTLTNRLRAELFETEKFVIVERGAMDAILKEQGFQQTGCTDATCAVTVGQLLNAEFIIVGTVDHIGRVYSVNIRQINVATGAITNNVRSDCADCAIEDVMLKKIRQAARQIAGIDTAREQDVVTEQKGRKVIRCKTYKDGEAGSLMLSGIPLDGEVFIDSISYGTGNMVIDYMPVGGHLVLVKYGRKGMATENVNIVYGKTTEFDFIKNQDRRFHFCLEPGLAIGFPEVSSSGYRRAFVSDNNPNDTLTAPSGSFTRLPLMPSLSFTWVNRMHAIGFMLGAIFTQQQVTRTDVSGNTFLYDFENSFLGIFLTYYRTIVDVKDYFKADFGLLAGGSYCRMEELPDHANANTTLQRYSPADGYQADLIYYDEDSGKYEQVMYGGPSVVLKAGYKFVFLKVTYCFWMGMNNQGNSSGNVYGQTTAHDWQFAVSNMLGVSFVFKL